MVFEYTSFAVTDQPEMKLVVYTPLEEAQSAKKLDALLQDVKPSENDHVTVENDKSGGPVGGLQRRQCSSSSALPATPTKKRLLCLNGVRAETWLRSRGNLRPALRSDSPMRLLPVTRFDRAIGDSVRCRRGPHRWSRPQIACARRVVDGWWQVVCHRNAVVRGTTLVRAAPSDRFEATSRS
jgi:hypothetical protein